MRSAKPPLISVVITTRNEGKNISHCLESIKNQSYPKERIEIIVVDNHSEDQTKDIARQYTSKVFDQGPERSAQRNYGLFMAKGDYLLYLDADMTLDRKVIASCVRCVRRKPAVVGLYISEIVSGNSYWSRVRRFERSFYDGTVIDCVRFVTASAFRQVGGFDTSLTGPEDWDFDKKIRSLGPVALTITSIHHNESEFNLGKYLTKKSYYAQSFSTYIRKWGESDPDIQRQFSPAYRYLGVFIERGKWRKVLFSPHLFLGIFFLRFLVGISYLLATRR